MSASALKDGHCEHFHRRKTGEVVVVRNEKIAADTWKIRLEAAEFAPLIVPGQFVMLRLPNRKDPLLGRPFAVYAVSVKAGLIDLIYLVVGRMTERLTEVRPGDSLLLTGPLGKGWEAMDDRNDRDPSDLYFEENVPSTDHLILIAGGIGQTALFMLAQDFLHKPPIQPMRKVSFLYGVRSGDRLCCTDDFEKIGASVHIATEDGSKGEKGYITDLLPRVFEESGIPADRTKVACCGPSPMLRAAALKAKDLDLRCWVSLESSMVCGLGICFGCVVDYLDDEGNWDYRRTCIDGPVFDASRLKWD
ncbi:MAG: dihydroorotate dehydrogenase electron transfer subunit [Planctomycetia bacterium]|nr:dihydroorotate dehydrogenase electron transfer subunit [Planctomycetia bacterium]